MATTLGGHDVWANPRLRGAGAGLDDEVQEASGHQGIAPSVLDARTFAEEAGGR